MAQSRATATDRNSRGTELRACAASISSVPTPTQVQPYHRARRASRAAVRSIGEGREEKRNVVVCIRRIRDVESDLDERVERRSTILGKVFPSLKSHPVDPCLELRLRR